MLCELKATDLPNEIIFIITDNEDNIYRRVLSNDIYKNFPLIVNLCRDIKNSTDIPIILPLYTSINDFDDLAENILSEWNVITNMRIASIANYLGFSYEYQYIIGDIMVSSNSNLSEIDKLVLDKYGINIKIDNLYGKHVISFPYYDKENGKMMMEKVISLIQITHFYYIFRDKVITKYDEDIKPTWHITICNDNYINSLNLTVADYQILLSITHEHPLYILAKNIIFEILDEMETGEWSQLSLIQVEWVLKLLKYYKILNNYFSDTPE